MNQENEKKSVSESEETGLENEASSSSPEEVSEEIQETAEEVKEGEIVEGAEKEESVMEEITPEPVPEEVPAEPKEEEQAAPELPEEEKPAEIPETPAEEPVKTPEVPVQEPETDEPVKEPENKEPSEEEEAKKKKMKTYRNWAIVAVVIVALAIFFTLTGSGETKVTADNAPSDLLKSAASITSDSDASDVMDVFDEIIDATVNAYDYHIIFDQSTTGQTLDTTDGDLTSVDVSREIYDVRYAASDAVYELYESETDGEGSGGVQKSSAADYVSAMTTMMDGKLGDDDAVMSISDLQSSTYDSADYSDEEYQSIYQTTVMYPLYVFMGSNLIIQPITAPDYYDFSLVKKGDQYVWTISMKDQEAYNEYIDEFYTQNYGTDRKDLLEDGSLVVDVYDLTKMELVLVMDENGVLQEIQNNSVSKIGYEDAPLTISGYETTKVSEAGEDFNTFFVNFFKDTADGKLANGSQFSVNSVINGTTIDEETTE